MIVTGNDLIVYDSDGADLVDASGMESGIVIVNDGDTLEGPDGTDHNVTVLGRGATTMNGGDGDDVVYTRGGSVTGSDGDDYVRITGAGTVQGEDGNDTLVGFVDPAFEEATVSDFSPAEDVMTIWVNQDILHEVTLTTEQGGHAGDA